MKMLNQMLRRLQWVGLATLVGVAVGIAGCGSSSDKSSSTSTATGANGSGTQTKPDGQPADLKPVTAPKATESIKEADTRILAAIDSGDCNQIAELAPLTRVPQGDALAARCKQFQARLEGAKSIGSEDFGGGGGAIDYTHNGRNVSNVLIVDQDGLYHVAYIDAFLGEKSVGTKEAKQFDEAAKAAVEALRTKDCKAFLAVANRRFGPGALDKSAACNYVDNNPIATLYDNYPDAKLKGLGGNADYALYELAGPGLHYTVVMVRETDKNLAKGAAPLPKDAPEYGFAGVFRTNIRNPAQ